MGTLDEQFCLKWNDFQHCIKSTFQSLREDSEFMDVTLSCDGEQIKAHKVILSACSVTFKNLLKLNPSTHPVFVLWDIEPRDLSAILDFMYNGEVNVQQENLNSFLSVAERLRVRGLCQDEVSNEPQQQQQQQQQQPSKQQHKQHQTSQGKSKSSRSCDLTSPHSSPSPNKRAKLTAAGASPLVVRSPLGGMGGGRSLPKASVRNNEEVASNEDDIEEVPISMKHELVDHEVDLEDADINQGAVNNTTSKAASVNNIANNLVAAAAVKARTNSAASSSNSPPPVGGGGFDNASAAAVVAAAVAAAAAASGGLVVPTSAAAAGGGLTVKDLAALNYGGGGGGSNATDTGNASAVLADDYGEYYDDEGGLGGVGLLGAGLAGAGGGHGGGVDPVDQSQAGKERGCEICGKLYKNRYSLNNHRSLKHPEFVKKRIRNFI